MKKLLTILTGISLGTTLVACDGDGLNQQSQTKSLASTRQAQPVTDTQTPIIMGYYANWDIRPLS